MNEIIQTPAQPRRIRSFFIKDILEHRSLREKPESPTSTNSATTEPQISSASTPYTVEHILSNTSHEERSDPCISGCCDCPTPVYPAYKPTAVTTPAFYHPYLYSFYRQQAAWRQSLKAVAYVDPQNALYSHVKQRKPRRPWTRAVFSNLQRKGLEKRFQVQKYLTKGDRHQLASMLGLSDNQVKVWFQNRRMKWRQEENTGEESESKADQKSEFQTSTVAAASSSSNDGATFARKE